MYYGAFLRKSRAEEKLEMGLGPYVTLHVISARHGEQEHSAPSSAASEATVPRRAASTDEDR